MHPASSCTALGQVVATLLSLSSLFALARSPPVFYFSFLGSFDPVFRCLQGVLVGPTLGPLLQPLAGLLLRLPRRPPLVSCHRPRVPCPPLVLFRLPLVFVGVEVAVAEPWSFRQRHRWSLPHYRRMTLSPLAMASSP